MQVCRCAFLHFTWAAVFARIACMYASVHRCLCNYAFIIVYLSARLSVARSAHLWVDLPIYISIDLCMYACTHVCVCVYYVCVCLYMRMRMRMYVCVYIARKEARKHKHVRLQVCFTTTYYNKAPGLCPKSNRPFAEQLSPATHVCTEHPAVVVYMYGGTSIIIANIRFKYMPR